MSELKIKVTWNDMVIELEGEAESVKEIFESLKDSGMGQMNEYGRKTEKSLSNTDEVGNQSENHINVDESNCEEIATKEIPTLTNVVLIGGPRTESEWILVYAFYKSQQGTHFFSREDLRQCYKETNRYTDARNKNFASNVKNLISDKMISAVNENDFRIEKKGIELAKKIVCGEIANGSTKGGKKKGTKFKNNTSEAYNLVELNLSQEERDACAKFYTTHTSSNNQDKVVVIAKWLKDAKGIDEVDKDTIFTILRTLGESASFNINQALLNAKNRKSYFVSPEPNKFKINHIGEDHVERDM